MELKTFFTKKIMMSFFVSTSYITLAMGILGIVFEPNTQFGYEAFFSPILFGVLATLPTLVYYSKEELSIKQVIQRNILHLLLLEIILLTVLSALNLITSIPMLISLAFTILIIDLVVNLVLWINDKRTANDFNSALKKLQSDLKSKEVQ